MKLLCAHESINLDLVTDLGNALAEALSTNNYKISKYLVSKGASPL